jgi:hypothetical protein
MNRFYRAVKLTLLIVALSTWFLAPIASAQTQTPTKTTSPEPKDLDLDEGWHVGFTPYIWFAGIHGTVGALNHDASVHATFGDIFNYDRNIANTENRVSIRGLEESEGRCAFRVPLLAFGDLYVAADTNRKWVFPIGELGRRPRRRKN